MLLGDIGNQPGEGVDNELKQLRANHQMYNSYSNSQTLKNEIPWIKKKYRHEKWMTSGERIPNWVNQRKYAQPSNMNERIPNWVNQRKSLK